MPRRRLPYVEPEPDVPEPTAQPSERSGRERLEEEDEKLVPMSNVGGAAPTPLGMDSGGDLPGTEDDLANLSEPEPPESPEVGAVHVVDEEEAGTRRR